MLRSSYRLSCTPESNPEGSGFSIYRYPKLCLQLLTSSLLVSRRGRENVGRKNGSSLNMRSSRISVLLDVERNAVLLNRPASRDQLYSFLVREWV
jgi:hypothetical protein